MSYLRRLWWRVLIDAAALILALWLAFMLRFDGHPGPVYLQRFYLAAPFFVLLSLPLFVLFGLYRSIWKYSGLRDYLAVFAAVTSATIPLFVARALWFFLIPYGVLGINWLISLLLLGGLRGAPRLRLELTMGRKNGSTKKILIVGAGEAGAMIARELRKPGLRETYHPIGYVDDDPAKHRRSLDGLRVLGGRGVIPGVVLDRRVDEIIIAMPSAPRTAIREIVSICRETAAALKILPGIYQLIDGQVSVKALRDVAIEDLLGRPPIATDLDEIASYLRGEVVLVTGAGGSIGSELCRQIARFNPGRLLLLGRGENAIYEIHQELMGSITSRESREEEKDGREDGEKRCRGEQGEEVMRGDVTRSTSDLPSPSFGGQAERRTASGDTKIIPLIADVRDRERLRHIFAEYRPAIVFHAAAHKHVPLMEDSPEEAVKNNVFGTLNAAELAHEFGARSFVLLSTDKAVRPTSILGATKRTAELIVRDLAARSSTRFCAVRFGNVLGSRGSVIPLFRRQIAMGGPVTVTDPSMVRFFMTIPEAADLVIQAGAMGKGGEIFVLDMGEPVRILDLARDLIRLSGYEPGKDVEIVVTGPRPGEKLYEEVLTAEEGISATKHERIFVTKPERSSGPGLEQIIDELTKACVEPAAMVQALETLVPDYAVDPKWRSGTDRREEGRRGAEVNG